MLMSTALDQSEIINLWSFSEHRLFFVHSEVKIGANNVKLFASLVNIQLPVLLFGWYIGKSELSTSTHYVYPTDWL